ncbi:MULTISPECIES: DVU_1551 family NTP transferase [Pelosinus]|uniref:Metal-dependent phosphohydrolase HD sub domain-containing protein n=1 Tax=Pelosinus fermentans B4 TaxID=1149862 RepID=I8RMV2_9FIRM|nr:MULTISPECIES: NTP transferase domain-containing protein [Pelosinus]EIW20255.1 metal-dependent phosphohydrolase HD sub domain-containing protein [Pelosinus fermentans B4]EIW25907.1 metal dependent phosphohydrolase [Pelosinus fermentans A11]OAM93205.1 metal dependent phosphohydrolase [Pelosinus fermentans DSM 17108]SDQ70257.1 CTP:molybdopterin cytidylyltransferase MocA [Pelosinus fermentans]
MWNQDKMGAVLLAAGYSSRMVKCKSLLPLGGLRVIERGINTFRQAGIMDITVVVGHWADELIPILDELKVSYVFNEKYSEGMFSSIVKGVQSLQAETKAFFLLPSDMPLVKSHTVRLLGRAFNKIKADIIYPVFQKHRGHPPLIGANCFPEILLGNTRGGLRQILERREGNAYEVEVFDEGILLDLDTHEDYQKIMTGYHRGDIPTQAECEAILVKMNVSEPIVNHGRMVAEIARNLALRLNQIGLNIDVHAVIAAGKLHDLAKGRPNHAQFGGRILKKYGYYKVAQIVAAHTDMEMNEKALPDEAAVVYLADKLVKGGGIVSIDERFSASMDEYAASAEAVAVIRERRLRAEKMEQTVEQLLGISLVMAARDLC